MFRYLLMLLALGYSFAVSGSAAVEPQIESISEREFAFDLGDSRISIEIGDPGLLERKDMLLEWVRYSAQTVHHYYGRFPVKTVFINVEVTSGHGVRFGQAFGGESPVIRVVVGEDITAEMLLRDWILVHEMVHLAMADVPRHHRWWLEGLATYVESIARAQRNYLSEEFIWRNFIERMPQGLPKIGDRGLDLTPTWGRTYWGGALFCMLADIEIRKLTDNRKSLREALRGMLDAGISMHTSATVMQVFEAGDRATGVAVLVPLYQKMKADPYPVDLDALWSDLGVKLDGFTVIYNDDAPMAHVRKRLLKS
ncbi:MAG: hypothetical protein EP300_02035 [Gammaproteobacteria bacterium]|nr:MAG: hypothetical protein EP300_02035 [Gammaproteobacteria bacterium]